MKQIVLAAAVMSLAAAFGAAGCKSQPKVEPSAPVAVPTSAQVEVLRAQYVQEFPNARIGIVSTVLDEQPYLTVEDIDTKDLKAGDWFTLLDGTETIIGYGRIISVINESRLAVQFEEKVRRPMVGDIAVKF